MSREPHGLGLERVGTTLKRSQEWTVAGRKIGEPTTVSVGFNVTGPLDCQSTEGRQFDRLAVKTTNLPVRRDHQLH